MYNEEIEEGRRHSTSSRPSETIHPPFPPPSPSTTTPPPPPLLLHLLTITAFLSFFALGGLVGVTGPALPSLAIQLGNKRETELGSAFTARGSGYLTGSFLASG